MATVSRDVWMTRNGYNESNFVDSTISFIVSDSDKEWFDYQLSESPSENCRVIDYHAWFLEEVEVIDGEYVVWNGDKYALTDDGSGIRISDVPV